MAKIKLTKTELKMQKDLLKRFEHYLPSLQLKKKQLQFEILRIHKKLDECQIEMDAFKKSIDEWIDVFSENIDLKDLLKINKVKTHIGNIAGVDIPVFEGVDFIEQEYDFVKTPIWLDHGIKALKTFITLKINCQILQKQSDIIGEELRITTQRVNLFEKKKIPETKDNIKKIQIYLGDMATAAVVIGKIAKNKIEKKLEALTV